MKILYVIVIAWLCAQISKFVILMLQAIKNKTDKKEVVKSFFKSGGMPSTHTSVVASLATTIVLNNDIVASFFHYESGKTELTVLALIFAAIVGFDACNVRLQCGDIAHRFNALAEKYYKEKGEDYEPIKVIDGHKIPEVIAGAVVGIVAATICHFMIF